MTASDDSSDDSGVDPWPDEIAPPYQPILPPVVGGGPRLPDRPPATMSAPPEIPPLQTTAPDDIVASTTPDQWNTGRFGASSLDEIVVPDGGPFDPLRTAPPPTLAETRWSRWALFAALLTAVVVTLLDATSDDGSAVSAPVVVVHCLVVVLVAWWSSSVVRNATLVVPPSRYRRAPKPGLVAASWVLAAATPVAVVALHDRWADRRAEFGEAADVALVVGVAIVAFAIAWLPFRTMTREASRLGAPTRPVATWCWLPIGAALAGALILAIGLRDDLLEDGLTAGERVVQRAASYGVPMFLAALTTWRATTVIDEVIDLRWQRWKREWEQTLAAMQAAPAPGPEGSPDLGDARWHRTDG